jgi:hypothetical protein
MNTTPPDPLLLPARLTMEQAARLLGVQSHDIPVLVRCRLLKPLGAVGSNTVKYFARTTILEHSDDPVWLDKATRSLQGNWRARNAGKRSTQSGSPGGAS